MSDPNRREMTDPIEAEVLSVDESS